jgi:transcriptional regulator with XRE-family HTH domain
MAKRTPAADDDAMARVRAIWAQKKTQRMTQQELGEAMGYAQASARKSVSQFFQTHDPRITMLRRFAKAVGVPISDIVRE